MKGRRDIVFVAALYALLGLLLYRLVWDLRPYPILGWVDDYRYVKSAWHMQKLEWLGPFDPTTLTKRPLFSVLLAATSWLHLPFVQFQIFFYLAGVAFFVHALLRLGLARWIAAALFAVLAFVPTLYDANGSRILRETSTVAVEFFIFGLALRMFLLPKGSRLADLRLGRNLAWLLPLYALSAFHWGMREEGILLSAAIAPLMLAAALMRFQGPAWKRAVSGLALGGALAAATLVCGLAIASANYLWYGVFLVKDISEGAFPKAVGVLKSIQEGPRPELLLEPSETRKLLELSPRFGQVGALLERIQARDPHTCYSNEMFFLRVSALQRTDLGRSARRTQDYFESLYAEVSELCARGRLTCDPNPRLSVIPRFTEEQWRLIGPLFRRHAGFVLTTRNSGFEFVSRKTPGVEAVPPEILAQFTYISRSQPFGLEGADIEYTPPAPVEALLSQQRLRRRLGDFYARVSPMLYGLAAAALLVFCPLAWRTGRREWLVLFAVLGLHVFTRLAAFTYLAALDGDLSPRLFTSAYPFALALATLAVCLTLAEAPFLRRRKT